MTTTADTTATADAVVPGTIYVLESTRWHETHSGYDSTDEVQLDYGYFIDPAAAQDAADQLNDQGRSEFDLSETRRRKAHQAEVRKYDKAMEEREFLFASGRKPTTSSPYSPGPFVRRTFASDRPTTWAVISIEPAATDES